MVRIWLEAFVLTQVVEMPIYSVVAEGRWWKRLAIAFGASAITHPIVWFVIMPNFGPYWTMVAIAEGFAFAAEAVYLRLLGVRRAWLWALVANAASFGGGLLYYRVRGSPF